MGLGSNLGDRAANLWEAVRRLDDAPGRRVKRLSPLYETEPIGRIPQADYLNAVVCAEVARSAPALLASAKRIEREMGRGAGPRWGPRVIDLDLLLFGDLEVHSDELTVPHPELWNRLFVLMPLHDVVPPGDLATRVQSRIDELTGQQRVRPYRPTT